MTATSSTIAGLNESNNVQPDDTAFHNWYRFILSYPPHLVRHYLNEWDVRPDQTLLDPFCGTGTTLVEGRLAGMRTVGTDANPMTFHASRIKTTWDLDPQAVLAMRDRVMRRYDAFPASLLTLPPATMALLIKGSIGEIPLSKCLKIKAAIHGEADQKLRALAYLALATTTVKEASNLKFSPNVTASKSKTDANVRDYWYKLVTTMAADLQAQHDRPHTPPSIVTLDDARTMTTVNAAIDMVITSPPYPCEHSYPTHTALESYVLGLYTDRAQVQTIKKTLLRSNSRGIYKHDDQRRLISHIQSITTLAATIEERRVQLEKTSGFERQYHRIIEEYFGGMAAHLANLLPKLTPGAKLAYVLGDQHSYFQVPVHTAQLLGEVADSLGYVNIRIATFRQRQATASGKMIDENVLLFEAPSV